jgi:hypothetical protein
VRRLLMTSRDTPTMARAVALLALRRFLRATSVTWSFLCCFLQVVKRQQQHGRGGVGLAAGGGCWSSTWGVLACRLHRGHPARELLLRCCSAASIPGAQVWQGLPDAAPVLLVT